MWLVCLPMWLDTIWYWHFCNATSHRWGSYTLDQWCDQSPCPDSLSSLLVLFPSMAGGHVGIQVLDPAEWMILGWTTLYTAEEKALSYQDSGCRWSHAPSWTSWPWRPCHSEDTGTPHPVLACPAHGQLWCVASAPVWWHSPCHIGHMRTWNLGCSPSHAPSASSGWPTACHSSNRKLLTPVHIHMLPEVVPHLEGEMTNWTLGVIPPNSRHGIGHLWNIPGLWMRGR